MPDFLVGIWRCPQKKSSHVCSSCLIFRILPLCSGIWWVNSLGASGPQWGEIRGIAEDMTTKSENQRSIRECQSSILIIVCFSLISVCLSLTQMMYDDTTWSFCQGRQQTERTKDTQRTWTKTLLYSVSPACDAACTGIRRLRCIPPLQLRLHLWLHWVRDGKSCRTSDVRRSIICAPAKGGLHRNIRKVDLWNLFTRYGVVKSLRPLTTCETPPAWVRHSDNSSQVFGFNCCDYDADWRGSGWLVCGMCIWATALI